MREDPALGLSLSDRDTGRKIKVQYLAAFSVGDVGNLAAGLCLCNSPSLFGPT